MDKPKEQDKYSETRTKELNRETYINIYELKTRDWFEVGSAYSLHSTLEDAKGFISDRWWKKVKGTNKVYVSSSTLEKILNDKEKIIWWSWEN